MGRFVKRSDEGIVDWVRRQATENSRVLKYGSVGFAGVTLNLITMAVLLTVGLRRGWMASAVASVVSTVCNFLLHNLWTFADRAHRGLRMIRGFLLFALLSALSIGVTTVFYIGFTHLTAHLARAHAHYGTLIIPLSCQFVAIMVGAIFSYVLNMEFTWPQTEAAASVADAQVDL